MSTPVAAGAYTPSELIFVGVTGALLLTLVYLLCCRGGSSKTKADAASEDTDATEASTSTRKPRPPKKQNAKADAAAAPAAKKAAVALALYNPDARHALFVRELKGHKSEVYCTAFTPDGASLVTSCERQLQFFATDSLPTGKAPRSTTVPVQLDSLKTMAISEDGSHLVGGCAQACGLRVYALSAELLAQAKSTGDKMTLVREIRHGAHGDMLSAGVGRNAYYVSLSDRDLKFFGKDGTELTSIDPNQMTNRAAAVSPDGRFVATCGWVSTVKLFEVTFAANGAFSSCARAAELGGKNGHKSSVRCLAFSGDSKLIATGGEDGTWKLWNLDVRLRDREDPRMLVSVDSGDAVVECIAIAPSGNVVAASAGNTLRFWNAQGQLLVEIPGAQPGRIQSLVWSPDSSIIVTAGGDKLPHIYQSPL